MARTKFKECVDDINTISKLENSEQKLLVPLSSSLYVPGKIKENNKFMVDVGTGYYIDKNADEAITFYQKKITKLNKEAIQIQDIIKEKNQVSLAIENQMREAAIKNHEGLVKQQQAQVE